MEQAYILTATRGVDGPRGLTLGYPTKEFAVTAANVIRHLWSTIIVTAPDGSLVLQLESNDA
jgi:hypothetical protein